MSDPPKDKFSLCSSSRLGMRIAEIKGAGWQIMYFSKPEPGSFTVSFNDGMLSRDCEARASVVIEVGIEGDTCYSSHTFDVEFNEVSREEMFQFIDGWIIRNGIESKEHFVASSFGDRKLFTLTLTVHSVKGPKLFSPPVWKFQDPNIPHDKVLLMDDGTRFYVQSQILSHVSEFFNKLFHSDFSESQNQEVAIRDVFSS